MARSEAEQLEEAKGFWEKDHAWHEENPKDLLAIFKRNNPDPCREWFERDVDRIIWSTSLKRLANKTQVYSLYLGDNQRQRLTHSLEVAQLAIDLAKKLSDTTRPPDGQLCRAMALAHDVGHTPFGHAGERALDAAFRQVLLFESHHPAKGCLNHGDSPRLKGLSSFTHYEQGLDAVSYIESPRETPGLGLTPTTMAGIFKHCRSEELAQLVKASKYHFSPEASVEAKIVRACDKLSYCIADFEDAARMRTMTTEEALELVKNEANSGNEMAQEVAEAFKKDPRLKSTSPERKSRGLGSTVVKVALRRMAAHLEQEINNPTPRYDNSNKQKPRQLLETLHKKVMAASIGHTTVQRADRRGAFIVTCLLCEYINHPEIILPEFRDHYKQPNTREHLKKLYRLDTIEAVTACLPWSGRTPSGASACPSKPLGCQCGASACGGSNFCQQSNSRTHVTDRSVFDIICAKDYIAGMTDNFAEERYARDVDCRMSRASWHEEGFDRAPAWPQY